MSNQMHGKRKKHARSQKGPPWYYYVFGGFLYAVIEVTMDRLLKIPFSPSLGALLRALILYACIWQLPRTMWERKHPKSLR